jgi:sugar lactone lactonase YvrE
MVRHLRLLLVPLVAGLVLATGAPAGGAPGAPARPAFPDRVDLPDGWAPEGITAGRGTSVYVGSLANGAIWRADVRSGAGEVLVPGQAGLVAVGVDYEARRDRLWVAGGPTGAVRVYDAGSGALLEAYQFAAGFLNDLVVTRDAVYVTDSMVQQLAVIPLGRGGSLPDPDDVMTVPLTGDIEFVAGEFNANGIVFTGGWLLVVTTFTGELFRVDPASGEATLVDLGGATVPGGDGLELHGRTLYIVRGGSNLVDAFRLRRSLRSAELLGSLTSPGLDFPATAAFTAGRLWAVNARFEVPPTPTTEYWITRLPGRP